MEMEMGLNVWCWFFLVSVSRLFVWELAAKRGFVLIAPVNRLGGGSFCLCQPPVGRVLWMFQWTGVGNTFGLGLGMIWN